jgi:hypothetical protein
VLTFNDDLMRLSVRFIAYLCFLCLFAACHRPTAYFQRTPHPSLATGRQSTLPAAPVAEAPLDSTVEELALLPLPVPVPATESAVASLKHEPSTPTASRARVQQHLSRIQSMLTAPDGRVDKQPRPKPKQKLRLGNRIREGLGIPLRKELNWWQRISWKLKASVIVILVALLFAIVHVTILAIIFGILGAFLLITGLKRSMKVRRPWF